MSDEPSTVGASTPKQMSSGASRDVSTQRRPALPLMPASGAIRANADVLDLLASHKKYAWRAKDRIVGGFSTNRCTRRCSSARPVAHELASCWPRCRAAVRTYTDAPAMTFRAISSRPHKEWTHAPLPAQIQRASGRCVTSRGDAMKPTKALHDLGQSLWLDNITRDLIEALDRDS